MNTVFKLYFQAWLLLSVAAVTLTLWGWAILAGLLVFIILPPVITVIVMDVLRWWLRGRLEKRRRVQGFDIVPLRKP